MSEPNVIALTIGEVAWTSRYNGRPSIESSLMLNLLAISEMDRVGD